MSFPRQPGFVNEPCIQAKPKSSWIANSFANPKCCPLRPGLATSFLRRSIDGVILTHIFVCRLIHATVPVPDVLHSILRYGYSCLYWASWTFSAKLYQTRKPTTLVRIPLLHDDPFPCLLDTIHIHCLQTVQNSLLRFNWSQLCRFKCCRHRAK